MSSDQTQQFNNLKININVQSAPLNVLKLVGQTIYRKKGFFYFKTRKEEGREKEGWANELCLVPASSQHKSDVDFKLGYNSLF